MSLDWLVNLFAIFDQSRSSLSPEAPNDEQQRGALPTSTRSRWRQYSSSTTPGTAAYYRLGWMWPFPFRRPAVYFLEHQGLIGSFFPRRKTGNSNSNISRSSLIPTTCLQEVHGRDEYLQAVQVLDPRFLFFGTFFPENANEGGSATCIHRDLLEEAIVTHLITCQGLITL